MGTQKEIAQEIISAQANYVLTLNQQEQWGGLQTVVIVQRIRRLWKETTHEVQFYLSTLEADAVKIGRAIRQQSQA
jgi:hypothetical protein